jgi:hypothetical protein
MDIFITVILTPTNIHHMPIFILFSPFAIAMCILLHINMHSHVFSSITCRHQSFYYALSCHLALFSIHLTNKIQWPLKVTYLQSCFLIMEMNNNLIFFFLQKCVNKTFIVQNCAKTPTKK